MKDRKIPLGRCLNFTTHRTGWMVILLSFQDDEQRLPCERLFEFDMPHIRVARVFS